MQKITQTMIEKRGGFRNPHRQSGYILIISVILLGAMLIATINYFEQSTDSIQMSGYNRDAAEALLLAESAMNMLYGQFVFGQDVDGDALPDRDETFDENSPNVLPLHYMYFRSNNNAIDAQQPSILQLVANGEARSGSARAGTTVKNHRVPGNAVNLLISELYANNLKPVLYLLDANNQLTVSNNIWTNVNNNQKAAVAWLELTREQAGANRINVYVQAAAKVGSSINYVQRYVGNYPTNLGPLGGANESSL